MTLEEFKTFIKVSKLLKDFGITVKVRQAYEEIIKIIEETAERWKECISQMQK